jgi:hypothetical protein
MKFDGYQMITYISSTSWSSLLEDNLTFGAELSEEDLSSVVLMLRDKISSLQEERKMKKYNIRNTNTITKLSTECQ